MPRTNKRTHDRSWREQHRQNALSAAKIAAAHLAQSGRVLRPRTSRKGQPSLVELAAAIQA